MFELKLRVISKQITLNQVKDACAMFIACGIWFAVEPLPFAEYYIFVKPENQHLLDEIK